MDPKHAFRKCQISKDGFGAFTQAWMGNVSPMGHSHRLGFSHGLGFGQCEFRGAFTQAWIFFSMEHHMEQYILEWGIERSNLFCNGAFRAIQVIQGITQAWIWAIQACRGNPQAWIGPLFTNAPDSRIG